MSPNKGRIWLRRRSQGSGWVVAHVQRGCGGGTMMMNRMQLAQWLGEADSESVAFSEIAEVLHLVLDASRRSLALASADELREVRFALAVLRDVFPHDDDVRAWLSAPAQELSGATPADLLSTGRVREFVDLAVTEWNRPGAFRQSRHRAMFVRA